MNRESVERLRRRNIPAVSGDAAEAAVLIQAHVARASLLVIATPEPLKSRKMVEIARTLNPRIETLLRSHSDEEAALMRQENLGTVFMGEHELRLDGSVGWHATNHHSGPPPMLADSVASPLAGTL